MSIRSGELGLTQWDLIALALAVGYVLASTLAFVVAMYLAARVLRASRRLWAGMRAACGGDLRTTLIGLGVATLLFSSVVPAVIGAALSFAIDFLSQLPNGLMRGWQVAESCRAGGGAGLREPSRCVIELAFGFGRAWADAIRAAGRFSSLPFASLLMFLAVWAVVGQLLTAPAVAPEAAAGARPWLAVVYGRLRPATRHNLLFFVVLGIAMYLSIAAIAAIPALREEEVPKALSIEKLTERITQATIPDSEFEKAFPAQAGVSNPFAALEGKLAGVAQAPAAAGTGQPPGAIPPERLERAKELLGFMRARREEEVAAWQQLRAAVHQRQGELRTTALAAFEAESVGRRGTQETRQHFLDVSSWFRSRVSQDYGRLRECRSQIEATGQWWQQLAGIAATDLESGSGRFDGSFDQLAFTAVNRTFSVCASPVGGEGWVPDRPRLGAFYGPFGFVASWLLQTESRDLALITGLLGFGLLGSAVSTFVRQRAKRQADGPLVGDLAGVVIRGLSAAVVVFLAVMGGLAIFSNASEPNPYVLLLTCLIGAVFSEDVWNWARRRLAQSLGEKSRQDDQTAAADPPGPSPGSPTGRNPAEGSGTPERDKASADSG